MIKTIVNAWKIADLRKKILYTVFILFLFRLGCAIPVPFINIVSENGLVGDVHFESVKNMGVSVWTRPFALYLLIFGKCLNSIG